MLPIPYLKPNLDRTNISLNSSYKKKSTQLVASLTITESPVHWKLIATRAHRAFKVELYTGVVVAKLLDLQRGTSMDSVQSAPLAPSLTRPLVDRSVATGRPASLDRETSGHINVQVVSYSIVNKQ